VETTQDRWAEAEMHRLRGTLLLSMHEHAAAERSYRHDRCGAAADRHPGSCVRLDLARLLRDRASVRKLASFAPVYGWFTEGFDTRDLKEAKALLELAA
jgi:predicted ATPase